MTLPTLTIISEKYCDLNPTGTRSTSHTTIYKTAVRSEQFSFVQHLYLEDLWQKYFRHIDDILLDMDSYGIRKTDIYFISWIGDAFINPTSRSLGAIPGKKVFIWPDTGWGWMPGALNRTNEAANYHLSYDTYNTEVINEHIYPKKLYLFGTPQDPDIFHDDTKELDVCFSGTIYEARKPYFEKLKALRTDSSLKLYLHEGQRVQNISADSYAENMRKSRINIDLPFSPNGTVTIKGRVYEALACNSLLLEYKNLEIEKMFKDGEHYVSFTSPEDMLDKISYFLKNTEEAEGIAKNGYNYYNTNYSPKVFWKRVVETDS